MNEFLSQAFVTLLVIIDPFAVVPVFVSLTRNETAAVKLRTAKKACTIAAIILFSFAFLGDKLLDLMSISEPAFRIAGGFLLLLAAIEMVVVHDSGFRSPTGDETKEAGNRNDISVFPLAIPLIAGPGALTSVVVLMRQAETINYKAQIGVVLLMLLVVAITFFSLRIGNRMMKILGITGTNVLTRVFGVILAALAVQNMIHGISVVLKDIIRA